MDNGNSLYKTLEITAVIEETSHAKSFELKSIAGEPINYEPGQFITLAFKKEEREDRRSYSFSSTPLLNEKPRITVKRVANGEYSRQLFDHVRVGDKLISAGVSGFFRLPKEYEKTKTVCFLAAGSGITPIYSLLKTVLHNTSLPVVLFYSNPSEKETIFYKELNNLQEQFPKSLTIEFLFSHTNQRKRRLGKWLLSALLEQHHVGVSETLFYLCGPADYMLTASISLITFGVPEINIRKENFNTRKHIFKPLPPDTELHHVKLSINNSAYNFPVQYPDTILAAAKKLHLQLPYSCEAGNCGSCTATCIAGKTWMAYNEVLTDDEIAKGKVLTCQAYAVGGDVELEF
ncbi:MAG: iron-sulfur cluster-binding domain-containing protein [Chitinophagaceae bacterium]